MERINIADILKDCPNGMELNSTVYDNLYFDEVMGDNTTYQIKCYTIVNEFRTSINFTKFGTISTHLNSKCVIFPKGRDTWEGFIPPIIFEDGDVVATNDGTWIGIAASGGRNTCIPTYCVIKQNDTFEAYFNKKELWSFDRLATEEEKNRLFGFIKAHGYKWNAETNTLERLIKPKFKVGDKIKRKNTNEEHTITKVTESTYEYSITKYCDGYIRIKSQDEWKLVNNKFDITTLVPFESKVLVRDSESQIWKPAIFGGYMEERKPRKYIVVGGIFYEYLIPYEDNKHLIGTTNDCKEIYKTWKNN